MRKVVSSSCIAAMLACGTVAYAQTTGQNPTGQAGAPTMTSDRQVSGDRAQTQQQMTLVGCIQREAEYRQAAGGGKGGTMGTGVGVGNEFVLVNASPSSGSQTSISESAGTSTPASPTGATSTTPAAPGTAGTTGTTSATATPSPSSPSSTASSPSAGASSGMSVGSGGKAYALTGNREKDLEQHVGKRVEIVGTLERSGAGMTSGAGTTPSAGAPASDTAGASQRLGDLQQINVVSFKSVSGSCSQ
jgi:hypothetical protein